MSTRAHRALSRVAAGWMFSVMAGTAHAGVEYSVTNLGTLGGGVTEPYAISDSGQIAGSSTVGSARAFRWDHVNGMAVLPSLPTSINHTGYAINADGRIVGRDSTTGNVGRGAAWSSGDQVAQLNPLSAAPLGTSAFGINDHGVAVGVSPNFLNVNRAVQWNADGSVTELGTLGGASTARDINDAGQVVGHFQPGSTVQHAFFYSNGQMTDLGTFGGMRSEAHAINNAGHIVGWAHDADNVSWAFVSVNGGLLTSLGSISGSTGSVALAINDAGQIVGRAGSTFDGRAFYWDSTSGMIDLNTLIDPGAGVTLREARGINADGWIIASGTIDGVSGNRAFLLRPVPAPGTPLIAAAALGAFGRRRRRTSR